MPNCPSCGEHAGSGDLVDVNGNLACNNCRKLRLISKGGATMSDQGGIHLEQKAPQKKLLELQMFELDTADGGKDHQFVMSVKTGSMLFSYSTTVDSIRRFFTERRKKGEAKQL